MSASTPWLLCRVRTSLCALPLAQIVEVMRPLPLIPLAQAPECVLGMCVMRGVAVPVVDAARCVLGQPGEPGRFVSVRAGERRMALAVDAVLGALDLTEERIAEVPSLLASASAAVQAVATLDREFLMLLQAGRVMPELDLPQSAHHATSD
jgi:purine-binding chemotaxis protein CheW